jgi:hypothetical protein
MLGRMDALCPDASKTSYISRSTSNSVCNGRNWRPSRFKATCALTEKNADDVLELELSVERSGSGRYRLGANLSWLLRLDGWRTLTACMAVDDKLFGSLDSVPRAANGLENMAACTAAEDVLDELLPAEAGPKSSTFAPVGFHGLRSSWTSFHSSGHIGMLDTAMRIPADSPLTRY